MESFYEVVDEVKPDIIISWGGKVRDALMNTKNEKGEILRKIESFQEKRDAFWNNICTLILDKKKIILITTEHPSRAFPRVYNHNIYKRYFRVKNQ